MTTDIPDAIRDQSWEWGKEAADDLRRINSLIYNGAPGPWQAVYNQGWHPALAALAGYLEAPAGRNAPNVSVDRTDPTTEPARVGRAPENGNEEDE